MIVIENYTKKLKNHIELLGLSQKEVQRKVQEFSGKTLATLKDQFLAEKYFVHLIIFKTLKMIESKCQRKVQEEMEQEFVEQVRNFSLEIQATQKSVTSELIKYYLVEQVQ